MKLRPRDKEILLLAARGMADKEIAQELCIATGTVSQYWERMRARNDCHSRIQLYAKWVEFGFK